MSYFLEIPTPKPIQDIGCQESTTESGTFLIRKLRETRRRFGSNLPRQGIAFGDNWHQAGRFLQMKETGAEWRERFSDLLERNGEKVVDLIASTAELMRQDAEYLQFPFDSLAVVDLTQEKPLDLSRLKRITQGAWGEAYELTPDLTLYHYHRGLLVLQ